jgi:hypothetical protein
MGKSYHLAIIYNQEVAGQPLNVFLVDVGLLPAISAEARFNCNGADKLLNKILLDLLCIQIHGMVGGRNVQAHPQRWETKDGCTLEE